MRLAPDIQPRHHGTAFTASPRGRRAFTMIEVMIVVILLAITAAIAMPMVGNRSDLKLAAAMRTMTGDVEYAQNYAIATRQSVYVKFVADQYSVCTLVNGNLVPIANPLTKMNFVVDFNGTSGTSPGVLAGVTMAKPSFSGDSVLAFDSLGAPFRYAETSATKTTLTTRAQVTVTCGSQTSSLYVEPYTGEVSVP